MVVRIADTNIENYAGPHFAQVNGDIVALINSASSI